MHTAAIYSTFYSGLGDTLFPDDDHDSRVLKSVIGQLVNDLRADGVELSQFAISERLASHVPAWLVNASPEWKPRLEERWLSEQRPRIFKAIGEFFLEGGLFARWAGQMKLISDLGDAGVEIIGAQALLEQLRRPGKWHAAFVELIVKGRVTGVELRCKSESGVDTLHVGQLLQAAGFGHDQIQVLLSEVHLPSVVPAARRAAPAAKRTRGWWPVLVVPVALGLSMLWNPLDYFLEAGGPAYYQARQVYLRGGETDRMAVITAFDGKKLTIHSYSAVVFPRYVRLSASGESPYPDGESKKSREQQRTELETLLGHAR